MTLFPRYAVKDPTTWPSVEDLTLGPAIVEVGLVPFNFRGTPQSEVGCEAMKPLDTSLGEAYPARYEISVIPLATRFRRGLQSQMKVPFAPIEIDIARPRKSRLRDETPFSSAASGRRCFQK